MKTIIGVIVAGALLTLWYFSMQTPPKPLNEADKVRLDSLILESSKRDLADRQSDMIQDQALDGCLAAVLNEYNQNKDYADYEKQKESCYAINTARVIEYAKTRHGN